MTGRNRNKNKFPAQLRVRGILQRGCPFPDTKLIRMSFHVPGCKLAEEASTTAAAAQENKNPANISAKTKTASAVAVIVKASVAASAVAAAAAQD